MTGIRLILRKTRANIPQLTSLVLLLMVGVCFFITLFTIARRYEESAEEYFIDNAYADVTFYGVFTDNDIEKVAARQGVLSAQGRRVQDFREGGTIFRVISLTDAINTPFLYDGRLPKTDEECVLLRRSAKAMGLSIGNVVRLGERVMTITGLIASPEYVYMAQNERIIMAPPDSFAVLYVTWDFYSEGYNELVARTGDDFFLDDAMEAEGVFRATLQKDQINHILYQNDLEEIRTFAYIFPFIFAVLIAAVIYVMLSRTIGRDRRQIGIIKALGVPDAKIIGIYLSQFCLAAFLGGLLGCLLSMLVSDGIVSIFSSMFEVPLLGFVVYPSLWIESILVAVVLCIISGMIALLSVLPLLPANAMRPRMPKGGKQIWIEHIPFLWRRFSWDTRYALKNALRNKGRFFAVVLGMCGCCALLLFSLGFYDSIGNTQKEYFRDFANYDVIIRFDPLPLSVEERTIFELDIGYKALVVPAEIRDENYPLAIVEKGFDMVNIPAEKLQTGVVIPEYFARQWGVEVGDTLKIDGYAVMVSAVTQQYLGLTVYTSFDYMRAVADDLPLGYNTVYGRSGDMAGLTVFLKDNHINFSTNDDDRASFDSILQSMSVLIWFMIACSVVLGFSVLYSVGLINLSARAYEYMFIGVMGYSHKGIMTACRKEMLFQLILAIPLGFFLGNLLLESIKDEFSGSNFVVSAAINPRSYVISALAVIGVAAVMAVVTSRHVGRLDIVGGLKIQDE